MAQLWLAFCDGGHLDISPSVWNGFSLSVTSQCLCLTAHKRDIMTGMMAVPRIAKQF